MLTIIELREYFSYDPDCGDIVWKLSRGQSKPGKILSSKNQDGYVRVVLSGRQYFAHRIAWAIFYGAWPSGQIDHINGNRRDNRIQNLREVDGLGNQQNRRSAQSNSGTGLLGVSKATSGRWRAQIKVNGAKIWLGTYENQDLAFSAYLEAKRKLHATCTI